MQGTAIPYLDMGGASLKMNDDGSFNLLIGATDLGTGSDTVLAQMAAEVLGVPTEDILVYSSDTDFTPFDKGAYASSTTYISGAAVIAGCRKGGGAHPGSRCADAERLLEVVLNPDDIRLADRKAIAPDGRLRDHDPGWLRLAAPRGPGADHGGGFLYVAGVTAAVCAPSLPR